MGKVPPLAEGFTDRPDTARGVVDALVPGSSVALVPGSAFAEGPMNWLGACGKTQVAVVSAESLWRSGAIDLLIWINATSRTSVLSAFVQASVPATGIEPVVDPGIRVGDDQLHLAILRDHGSSIGDVAPPSPWIDAFVPDVLERGAPVPGAGWLELDDQGLVPFQPEGTDHVEIVRRGVGRPELRGLRRDQLIG